MLLDYATSGTRRVSRWGIVSMGLGITALAMMCLTEPFYPFFYYIWALLLVASAAVAFGAIALITRRGYCLWWLGLIGLTSGATVLSAFAYFLLTFSPPVK
jgi:hypothetical protein